MVASDLLRPLLADLASERPAAAPVGLDSVVRRLRPDPAFRLGLASGPLPDPLDSVQEDLGSVSVALAVAVAVAGPIPGSPSEEGVVEVSVPPHRRVILDFRSALRVLPAQVPSASVARLLRPDLVSAHPRVRAWHSAPVVVVTPDFRLEARLHRPQAVAGGLGGVPVLLLVLASVVAQVLDFLWDLLSEDLLREVRPGEVSVTNHNHNNKIFRNPRSQKTHMENCLNSSTKYLQPKILPKNRNKPPVLRQQQAL